MILSKNVKLKISTSNDVYLSEKGYKFNKIKDIIEVKVSDLSHSSHAKILVKCDVCECKKKIEYRAYLKNIKKYNLYTCSQKCAQTKNKQTCLELHGDKNYNNREKYKKTNLERFGSEYPIQNNQIKEKIKQTCLEKYGVENLQQNNDIKEKTRLTCLERFGVEYTFQSKEIREKSKQTCLEHFGVEYPGQSEICKEKSKKTCLEKYGFEYASQNKEIMNKIIQTQIERYGEIWMNNVPSYNPNSIIYLDMISEMLNIPIQHALNGGEKKIVRYWIDGFIEQYNICIEWDEPRHKNNKEYDEFRENYIKENKGCKFVRINEKEFLKDIEKGISDVVYKINEFIKNGIEYGS